MRRGMNSSIKRIAVDAMLTATALIIFIVEAQIPPIVPIPGVKLGLANVITLFAIYRIGRGDAFAILIVRITLGAIFSGSVSAFVFSLTGGLLCFIATSVIKRFFGNDKIWVYSIIGALFHNLGQTLAATAFLRSGAVWIYFPALALSAIITGALTGVCAQIAVKRLQFRL